MKSKDIRLGNLFVTPLGDIVEVSRIYDDGFYYQGLKNNELIGGWNDNEKPYLKPIPLDDKFIRRLGFKYLEKKPKDLQVLSEELYTYKIWGLPVPDSLATMYIVSETPKSKSRSQYDIEYVPYLNYDRLWIMSQDGFKYIHQLQNLWHIVTGGLELRI